MVVALPVELKCAGQIELGVEVFEPAPNTGAGAAISVPWKHWPRKKTDLGMLERGGLGNVATRDVFAAAVGNGAVGATGCVVCK